MVVLNPVSGTEMRSLRNAEIYRLHTTEGVSIADLADRYGLSKNRIREILIALRP